jgi:hypothetical protein
MNITEIRKEFNSNSKVIEDSNNIVTQDYRIEFYKKVLSKHNLLKRRYNILDVACGKGEIVKKNITDSSKETTSGWWKCMKLSKILGLVFLFLLMLVSVNSYYFELK